MALFNYATKEITLKIVYYGPGLSGKTTNLQYLHASVLQPESTGKLLSLATESDRTLFFDFLPVELGKIRDFTIRFQLYTVPGQVRYNATRKVVLKGADAVVFVADSQKDMQDQNIESFENMRDNLVSNNINPDEIPVVLQFNKRDLKTISTVEEINGYLNPYEYPVVEGKAISGGGVEETFKLVTRLMLKYISKKHKIEIQQPAPGTAATSPAAPAKAVAPPPSRAAAQPVPETPVPPRPLTVEEAIEVFPAEEEEEEVIEVAGVGQQEPAEPVFELPDDDETAPPFAFTPPRAAAQAGPAMESGPVFSPAPIVIPAPAPALEQPPEPERTDGPLFEAAPGPVEVPSFEKSPGPRPVEMPAPEPRPARAPEAARKVSGLTPTVSDTSDNRGGYQDHAAFVTALRQAMQEVKASPSVSPEAFEALRDDIRQVRDVVQELRKVALLVDGTAQTNGILTDLKNTVYILSKEVRELKEIHRSQDDANALLRSMASALEGLKETNSLLRSLTATFDGLKKSKGWLKF